MIDKAYQILNLVYTIPINSAINQNNVQDQLTEQSWTSPDKVILYGATSFLIIGAAYLISKARDEKDTPARRIKKAREKKLKKILRENVK